MQAQAGFLAAFLAGALVSNLPRPHVIRKATFEDNRSPGALEMLVREHRCKISSAGALLSVGILARAVHAAGRDPGQTLARWSAQILKAGRTRRLFGGHDPPLVERVGGVRSIPWTMMLTLRGSTILCRSAFVQRERRGSDSQRCPAQRS